MLLIPAIDLHDGKCVQLRRGLLSTAKQYSDDPYALASYWIDQGARRIHVVDLDGAFKGQSVNSHAVERIIDAAGRTPVQLGGGVRDEATVRLWLNAGISQVIIGTKAVSDPDFITHVARQFSGRVILGLDARDNHVSIKGWTESTSVRVEDLISQVDRLPLYAIVYTDISRDGMLTGVNIEANERLLQKTRIPLIASGGVQRLQDLRRLSLLRHNGRQLFGAISGSALYENQLSFREGQHILNVR